MSPIEDLIAVWKKSTPDSKPDSANAMLLLEGAESLFTAQKADSCDRITWIDYLNTTKKTDFLKSLKDDAARLRWSEVVFKILQHTDYSLRDMLDSRVNEHPDRILFREMSSPNTVEWTYEQIQRHLREIAAVFYHAVKTEPRVAVYADNCLEGVCSDLACLCYDIFDTPLSIHFSADILIHIFDLLKINIAVADSKERCAILLKIKAKTKTKFKIFTLSGGLAKEGESEFLQLECKKFSGLEIGKLLGNTGSRKNTEVATTMRMRLDNGPG